jgi:hypothetical protein
MFFKKTKRKGKTLQHDVSQKTQQTYIINYKLPTKKKGQIYKAVFLFPPCPLLVVPFKADRPEVGGKIENTRHASLQPSPHT